MIQAAMRIGAAGREMCRVGAQPGGQPGSQPEAKPETRFGEITAGSIQEGVGALVGIVLPMGLGLTAEQRQSMKTEEHRTEKKINTDVRHDREEYDLIARLATQRNFALLKMPEKAPAARLETSADTNNNIEHV